MKVTHTVARNSAALFLMQTTARLLSIFYAIALSRYLGATGIGKVAIAIALTTAAYVLVDLGFGVLTVRDISRDRAQAITYFSNITLLKITSIVLVNIVLALFLRLSGYSSQIVAITWIYSFNSALTALLTTGVSIFQGIAEMHKTALLQLGRDVANIGFSLLAIGLHATIYVIVWVSVLATLFQAIGVLVLLKRDRIMFALNTINLDRCRAILINALPFGAFLAVSTLYGQLSVVMMSLSTSERQTGFYSIAMTFLSLLALLPAAFSQALFPVFSRYHSEKSISLQSAYKTAFIFVCIIGFGLSFGAFMIIGDAVKMLFGRQYAGAVPVAMVLVLSQITAANYINGTLLNSTGRERLFTFAYGIFIAVQSALNWLLIPPYGAVGAAWGFLIPGLLGFLFFTFICHRIVGLSFPWLVLAKCGLASGLMILAVRMASIFQPFAVMNVLIIGPIVYIVAVFLLKISASEDWLLIRDALSYLIMRFVPTQAINE